MGSELHKIFFIPAPDMSPKAINLVRLSFSGYDVVALDLSVLRKKDIHLQDCVDALCQQIPDAKPSLLGFCYGGVLALEMAKVLKPSKVIIVSAIKDTRELPMSRILMAKFFGCLPGFPLYFIGNFLSLLLNKILHLKIKIPRIWKKWEQNKFILRHMLQLDIDNIDTNIFHIHGNHDKVFPVKKIKNVQVIAGGGHFLLTQKYKKLIDNIEQCL